MRAALDRNNWGLPAPVWMETTKELPAFEAAPWARPMYTFRLVCGGLKRWETLTGWSEATLRRFLAGEMAPDAADWGRLVYAAQAAGGLAVDHARVFGMFWATALEMEAAPGAAFSAAVWERVVSRYALACSAAMMYHHTTADKAVDSVAALMMVKDTWDIGQRAIRLAVVDGYATSRVMNEVQRSEHMLTDLWKARAFAAGQEKAREIVEKAAADHRAGIGGPGWETLPEVVAPTVGQLQKAYRAAVTGAFEQRGPVQRRRGKGRPVKGEKGE